MASIDPELRRRQLAGLRVDDDASPDVADQDIGTRITQHSRVLLGRMLVALTGQRGSAEAPDERRGPHRHLRFRHGANDQPHAASRAAGRCTTWPGAAPLR